MSNIASNLFKTLAWAIPASFIVNIIFFLFSKNASDNESETGTVVALLAIAAIYLNIIIFIITLPALFLKSPNLWAKVTVRFLLYFAGPLLFIAGTLTAGFQHGDFEPYLFTGIVYLIIHAIYYKKLAAKRRKAVNITEL